MRMTNYHALFGAKFLLAMAAFYFASALVGRGAGTQWVRNDRAKWLSVTIGLTLAVVISALAARSLRSTVVACVPPFVGAVWALGLLGLTGQTVNVLTTVVPSLALVVGTCDSDRKSTRLNSSHRT